VPDDAKSKLRREVSACLQALDPAERLIKSQRAIVRLLSSDEYRRARTVAAYASFGNEFPTAPVLEACLHDRKTIALPRVLNSEDCSMNFHAIQSVRNDLVPGLKGFREPKESLPVVAVSAIDLLIVPGIAFDLRLNRLGRGAGFYDRFLSHLELHAELCALAYECQIVDNIPTLPHDRAVEAIFTEDRVIR
jgi:5-formyltetrahydrofolate cyclo-ligase